MRNVAASTLHDDAPCIDGIGLEISSLSHVDGVVIANRKKVVAWAEIPEIDRAAVTPSGLDNPRIPRATRSQLHKNTLPKRLQRDVVLCVACQCTSGHSKKEQSGNQILNHGRPPSCRRNVCSNILALESGCLGERFWDIPLFEQLESVAELNLCVLGRASLSIYRDDFRVFENRAIGHINDLVLIVGLGGARVDRSGMLQRKVPERPGLIQPVPDKAAKCS